VLRRLLPALIVVASLGASTAQAQQLAPEPEEDEHRLEWSYPLFRPAEYIVTAAMPMVFRTIDHNFPEADRPRWTGDNAFDDAVQSWLGDRTEEERLTLDRISTLTWRFAQVFPFVDSAAVALIDDFNLHVGWQMTMINVAALSFQALIKLVLHRTVARNRPNTAQCIRDGSEPEDCRIDNTNSFPSGHASSAFTGAGLVCAHHTNLPLYGGNTADTTACVTMLTLATATGVMRIAGDKHYTLDVLASVVLGLGSGWLLPWLLHYRFPIEEDPGSTEDQDDEPGPGVAVLPMVEGEGGLGLSAAGWF